MVTKKSYSNYSEIFFTVTMSRLKYYYPGSKLLSIMNFRKIRAFLRQPYPYYFEGTVLWIVIGLIFFMTWGFNYLFEPFGPYPPEHKMDYFFICGIHAIVPTIVFLALQALVKWKSQVKKNWIIQKEVLFLASFFLLVGIGQFLVRDLIYDNPDNWSWRYLWEETRNTFLVGTLFTISLVPLNFIRLYRQNDQRASQIAPHLSQRSDEESLTIFIKTQVKGDNFDLTVADFLFARAERNYVEIYLQAKPVPTKLLKRITIKDLHATLSHLPYI
ncbi:MAG: hypothetical protein WBA23_03510, partial [Tunicatimonas sp.]|uniref:hypothetical protein n=1 Tax=Tunicatimonas sp. TaxID=1940096 RepID=UPI003C77F98C